MGEHDEEKGAQVPEPEDLMDPDKPYSAENPRKGAVVSKEGEDTREEREAKAAESAAAQEEQQEE